MADADLTYEAGTYKDDQFYDVEHRYVLFLSQTSLRAKSKSDTFNCNAIICCRFAEAVSITSVQEDYVPHIQNKLMLEALRTDSARS